MLALTYEEASQQIRLPSRNLRLCTKMPQHFSWKRVYIRKQEWHFMGQYIFNQVKCHDEVAQSRKHLSHWTCPFRPGENWDTYTSCSGWSLPTVYRLGISIRVRPRKKNRKKILRTKEPTHSHLQFFPAYLYSDQNILKNYSRLSFPPLKFNFLLIFHEKNTIIVQRQDITFLKNKNKSICSNFLRMT